MLQHLPVFLGLLMMSQPLMMERKLKKGDLPSWALVQEGEYRLFLGILYWFEN